ncbi:MAG: TolC family protein [Chlamydiia bacterium]|nr:TolC family protein [Chlamydiia bacterium]
MKALVLAVFVAPLCVCAEMTLEEAESLALSCNKQYLIAQESTTQAKERKKQAVSSFLPRIQYRAEFHDAEKPELFLNTFTPRRPYGFSHQGYLSTLELQQTVFSTDLIFGLMSRDIEMEVYQLEQANTKNELLRAVRQRYYAVVYYENALQIARENVDYLGFALQQEEGRLSAGSATTLEVNQSKVAVANAISQYYDVLKELKRARNNLVFTLGMEPLLEPNLQLAEKNFPLGAIPEIARRIQELDAQKQWCFTDHLTLFTPQDSNRFLDLALTHRPDLKAAKYQVSVAEKNVQTKQGNYLPKISGYVRLSYNDDQLGLNRFGAEQYNWTAGIRLTWTLFDSLLREHEIREAKSIRAATRIGFDREYQKVELEVRNDLYLFEESLLTYYSSSEAVLLAEQAREQAKDKLEFGRIPPLDYRDAVNQLAQAKNRRNKACLDLISAHYDLRYAIGQDI